MPKGIALTTGLNAVNPAHYGGWSGDAGRPTHDICTGKPKCGLDTDQKKSAGQ